MKEASLALVLNMAGELLAASHEVAGWSLLGGKAEDHDLGPKSVLERELREELGVDVHPQHMALVVQAQGTERLVRIYHVSAMPAGWRAAEGQELRWMTFSVFLAETGYAPFYRRAFPDDVLHFRPTRFDPIHPALSIRR